MLVYIGWIILLIMLSAFFSGSETGLTGASKARIHRLKSEGNKRAEMVSELLDKKERLIGSILLGNNLVNIAATVLLTTLCIEAFGENYNEVLVTCVMTLVILIFAEVAPKSYAINHPEKVALTVAPIFVWIVKVFAPVTHAVQIIVIGFLRALGVDLEKNTQLSDSVEVLRGAIDLHHDRGGVVKDDKDMLGGVLDLNEIDVSEVMIHRKDVYSLDIMTSKEEVIGELLNSSHTRIPFWRDNPDEVIGVLHSKDLMRALHFHKGKIEELDLEALLKPAWFIPETTNLKDQLDAFREKSSHFSFVVDEYGAILGIITLEDIIEEIVGQITDETDAQKMKIRLIQDGSFMIDGDTTIRDINRELDWGLPDEEASTLAGMIIHEAQLIPNVGQIFHFFGFKFEIRRKKSNQITMVRVMAIEE